MKRCKNIHTSFLDQGILYEYLQSGAFHKQIKKVRKSIEGRKKTRGNQLPTDINMPMQIHQPKLKWFF